ncbi:hypothetical protein ENBRE01_0560 [Enteropsectra breve]|nr:hypothetical protein ENBRE01_0560 [Enteropsectra breve]
MYLVESWINLFALKLMPVFTASIEMMHPATFSVARFPLESSEHAEIPRAFILKDRWHSAEDLNHIITVSDDIGNWRLVVKETGFKLVSVDFETEFIPANTRSGTRIAVTSMISWAERVFKIERNAGEIFIEQDLSSEMSIIGRTPDALIRLGFEEVRLKANSIRGYFLLHHSD